MRNRVRVVATLALAAGALAIVPSADAKPGDVIVAELNGPGLLRVNPQNGHAHTIATIPPPASRACYLTFEGKRKIAVTDENEPGIWVANTATGSSHQLALSGAALSGPYGIDTDAKGNLIVADYGTNEVVRVSHKTHHVHVLASGPWLGYVQGVAVNRRTGTIFVLDAGGAVDRLSPKGHLSTLASGPPFSTNLWTITRAPGGALYVTDEGKDQLDRVNPKTGAAHKVASLAAGTEPDGVAAASRRTVYVSFLDSGAIVRVNVKTGHVAPIASGLTDPLGITIEP